MTTRLSGIALAGLIAALGATACGSDDSGKKASPAKGGEKTNTEGQVPCGPTTCKPKEGFMGQLCCKSNFEGTCGQMVAGSCTDLPPDPDKRCESTTFMAGGSPVMIPSCCTANNECGLVFNAGIGTAMCTSLVQAKQFGARFMTMSTMGNMMFNFNGMLPDPVTCDGDPIEVPAAAAGSGASGAAGSGT
jgi:hypothetical protein